MTTAWAGSGQWKCVYCGDDVGKHAKAEADRDALRARAEAAEALAADRLVHRVPAEDWGAACRRAEAAEARVAELKEERTIALASFIAKHRDGFWSILDGTSYRTTAQAEAGVLDELKRRQKGGER